jgi:hypothetical protein
MVGRGARELGHNNGLVTRLDPPYEGVNLLRDWSKKIADAAATMILYEH